MGENTSENNNILELKSIADIKDKEFIIPSFQRGYRWEPVQVITLLEDIKEYIEKANDIKTFMCLQPVVFYKNQDNKLIVIDGQQRLTTMAIISKCLDLDNINIEYNKYNNKALQDILKNVEFCINPNDINNLFNDDNKLLFQYTNKKYKDIFLSAEDNSDKVNLLDGYYIILSYLTIKCWLENKKNKNINIEESIRTLLKSDKDNFSIKFIWYDVTGEVVDKEQKAIDIFTRLNIGKIPLTDAELIKALFLKNDNFKDSELDKKLHIAYKWDEIEKTLNNDSFWYFISNDKGKSKKDRIELILELAADKTNGKNHELFFNYEQVLKTDLNTRWSQIEECFMVLKEWYNDNKMYHYIGFLVYSKMSLRDIYKNKISINNIILKVIKKLLNIEKDDNIDIHKIKHCFQQYNFNNSNHKIYLKRILLLVDIYNTIQSNAAMNSNKEKTETFIYKFPFDLFIKEKWDIEHISPQTPNKLKSNDEQKKWFIEAYTYLYDKLAKDELLNIYPDIKDKNDLKNLEDTKSDLYKKIILEKQFKNILELDIFKLDNYENTIGNLVLLSYDINRSYGNQLYGIKKSKIIEYDKKGRFIPIITKNAFLKYYSKTNNANFWTIDDAQDLFEEIACLINNLSKSY